MTKQDLKECIAEVTYSDMHDKTKKKVLDVLLGKEKDGWIPSSERLPEKNQQVIYCDESGLVGFALYTNKNTFWDNCVEFDDVIAWMPLPAPYEKGE